MKVPSRGGPKSSSARRCVNGDVVSSHKSYMSLLQSDTNLCQASCVTPQCESSEGKSRSTPPSGVTGTRQVPSAFKPNSPKSCPENRSRVMFRTLVKGQATLDRCALSQGLLSGWITSFQTVISENAFWKQTTRNI